MDWTKSKKVSMPRKQLLDKYVLLNSSALTAIKDGCLINEQCHRKCVQEVAHSSIDIDIKLS